MTAKITLYSEDGLIREVKKFAKQHNTSVSKLVNGFFNALLSDTDKDTTKQQITSSLLGVIKNKSISEADYDKYIEDKYL